MKINKLIALIGLFITTLGPILTFANVISISQNKLVLIIGMVLWFIGATPWLGREELKPSDTEVEI